jgi:hypothetical protein
MSTVSQVPISLMRAICQVSSKQKKSVTRKLPSQSGCKSTLRKRRFSSLVLEMKCRASRPRTKSRNSWRIQSVSREVSAWDELDAANDSANGRLAGRTNARCAYATRIHGVRAIGPDALRTRFSSRATVRPNSQACKQKKAVNPNKPQTPRSRIRSTHCERVNNSHRESIVTV